MDLHNLNDRAKRFVVGVASDAEDKERLVSPTNCFLVLDELNKYAPREAPARSRRSFWTSPSVGARSV